MIKKSINTLFIFLKTDQS